MTVVAAPVTAARRTAPVSASERIHSLDIIRGFALFGMILVHFHQKMRVDVAGVEDLIPWAVWIFLEQKAALVCSRATWRAATYASAGT